MHMIMLNKLDFIYWGVRQLLNDFNLKGQARFEVIIPIPVVLLSSPLLSLSIQRKIDAVCITISISVINFL